MKLAEILRILMKGSADMSAIQLVLDGDEDNSEELAPSDILSREEKLQAEAFSQKINLNKTETAASYGATVQRQAAAVASKTLDSVKSMRTADINELLVRLVAAIDSLEDGRDKSGSLSLFLKRFDLDAKTKIKKENAESEIDLIEKQLEGHLLAIRKDIVLLDKLYDENIQIRKALEMYIMAGEQALERAYSYARTAVPSMSLDIFKSNCEQFDKQLHELRMTQAICMQSCTQLRMMRKSDEDLLIKLQSSIVNTIPLWKQRVATSAGMSGKLAAVQAIDQFDKAARARMSLAESVKLVQSSRANDSAIETLNREITSAVSDTLSTT